MDSSSETQLCAQEPQDDTSLHGKTMQEAPADAVLAWYDRHARDLPWRARPGCPPPDPYRVWLSEVMLQQTTVAAVKAYFAAFTARWPTVEDLAAAADEDVMAAWAGLGYYARARNLLACAREVAARGGRFPAHEAGLRALPGLGSYTAAAVAAIAFGQRAVVVDANVERVVARLFALDDPLPGGRARIRDRTEAITPQTRAGDFAQGMMDLGATICTARNPRCMLCPLQSQCMASASGEPERFPVKAPKKPKPQRRGQAWWIKREKDGIAQVLLVRRPARGMLAGMRALPDDGWSARADGSGAAPIEGRWEALGHVRHVFTHAVLDLSVSCWRGPDGKLDALAQAVGGEWWPVETLAQAGLPTLYARAASLALA